ncbi:MAG: RluA family pseudouridine synthase [Frisingicoccus sp.]|uniref:RluA family pseudouridine synthase n=1 Tax=Frisingicoccus sp. TaxID=1918627 RepID=UPI002A83DAC0|nr:RluA family pseudouridine synthase [Frisingicoccus sp.]MDY4835390.1 RluA family pseudouridine synthase [Frisingicoccus sp.]
MNSWSVDTDANNMRIDRFISERMSDTSRSYIQKLIKDELVTVDSKVVKSNYKVKEGEWVEIVLPEPVSLDIEAENIPLDILYEDSDVLLVNKPKDMVVHPSAGHITGTLVNALLYHCKDSLSSINGVMRPGIVHRIDKDTTGILIICKNDKSHNCIAEQLKVHSITRRYHALVWNNITDDTGTIDAPIGRHPVDRKKMAINHKNGKQAVTHYKVLERFGQYTYIQCELETGRTHQIRVHMASIGHPLVGDPVYGPAKQPFKTDGQMLHAKVFGFIHPSTNEYMEFETDLPEYFQLILEKLRNKGTVH